MKTYIKTDNNGNIESIVKTNDKSIKIGDNKNVYDFTDKDISKIRQNTNYFKIKDGNVEELSETEKKIADEKIKIFKNKPKVASLEEIIERINKIEEQLKK